VTIFFQSKKIKLVNSPKSPDKQKLSKNFPSHLLTEKKAKILQFFFEIEKKHLKFVN